MSQGPQPRNGDIALVAVGSNATSDAGDPRATVLSALARLRDTFGNVLTSNLYQTPAFPVDSGPDFVNAACAFRSEVGPRDLLETLHQIEASFGRTRTLRWGQRTLDLDLIACGDRIEPDIAGFDHWKSLPIEAQKTRTPDRLILPHPRLQDRPFVLVPLADVAPDWCHPVLNLTVTQMIATFTSGDVAQIRSI
ncbi:2-amino-4-hydroxy-6-hydroxymethyldihydropteridine diphosphokinase [Octadecabacter sp. G9-8]|uniref:2-amino-4-hydroxy-6-hydroxymethyldihydropteridine pyrophosphokinase n=1 Tax=Octadecabacter dasysiphoniae TaxID=2909341 RepID=A0ABS9CYC1_9RHOB|nr:2-amino-4-hydroxy-6-hydroxymethyldihydropteridine diphosphokinase [Octadecabacter dasysiphoniae]MCF2871824.1 2-amino-4-hydroxy-6-hydroxymethyldihydropteridine diphosphokinase [Octadecabacter dasysiphoniae]